MPTDPNITLNITLGAPPISRAGFGTLCFVKDGLFDDSSRTKLVTRDELLDLIDDDEFTEEEEDALLAAFAQSPRPNTILIGCTAGGDASLTASLNAIAADNGDFYRLVLLVADNATASDTATDIAAVNAFCAATDRKFYVSIPNDVALDGSGDLETAIAGLGALALSRTLYVVHPDPGYATALAFRQSSVDLDQRQAGPFNRVLTGFADSELTTAQRAEIDAANGNYVLEVARGRNALRQATMADGQFPYVVSSLDWFSARVREDYTQLLLDYAARDTKLPLTNEGIAAVEQVLQTRLSQGVAADHFAPGGTRTTFPSEDDILPDDRAAGRIRGSFLAQILVGTQSINIDGTLTLDPIN